MRAAGGGRWALGPRRSGLGSRCWRPGRRKGSPGPACARRAGPWASGKKKKGWLRCPGEERCGGRVLRAGELPRSRGAPGPSATALGIATPRARETRLRERRAHTRAHTPGEHAQCGPGNFLPSRQPPRPPPGPAARKVGGGGARVTGVAPACRGSAPPAPALPLPGLSALPAAAPAAGHGGVDVILGSPGPGGQRPGGTAVGRVPPLAVLPLRARPLLGEQTGGRGCVSPGTLARTLRLSHTKPWFPSHGAEREGVALALCSGVSSAHWVLGVPGLRESGDAYGFRRCWS